jgi:hypothetical protein
VYQVSTYAQKDPVNLGKYEYARGENPTREALEQAIAELEGGAVGLAFASGMAAISSVLLLFRPGDHLLVAEDVYGGTYRVVTTIFRQWGLESTFVDTSDPGNIAASIRPETRGIFVETPSNPILKITDLAAVSAIAREKKLLSIVDNTFMTPYLQRPIEHGFDIIVHSATKFLGGHSDLIAGLVVTRDAELGGPAQIHPASLRRDPRAAGRVPRLPRHQDARGADGGPAGKCGEDRPVVDRRPGDPEGVLPDADRPRGTRGPPATVGRRRSRGLVRAARRPFRVVPNEERSWEASELRVGISSGALILRLWRWPVSCFSLGGLPRAGCSPKRRS